MYVRKFCNLYLTVFDENGNVKNCGRALCQELILLADQIEQDVKHGDAYTGMMDTQNIKNLYKKVNI